MPNVRRGLSHILVKVPHRRFPLVMDAFAHMGAASPDDAIADHRAFIVGSVKVGEPVLSGDHDRVACREWCFHADDFLSQPSAALLKVVASQQSVF